MTPLRRILFVLALLAAQWVAGAHAVEHLAGKEGALPTHVCELCLAAHDLSSALPVGAALPPVAAGPVQPDSPPVAGRHALPPPPACQGAPPLA